LLSSLRLQKQEERVYSSEKDEVLEEIAILIV